MLPSGLLTEEQARTVLAMARDRNLTVHAYNEELADQIYARLPAHTTLYGRLARRDGAGGRPERGYVGADPDGRKPREVLNRPDWLEEVGISGTGYETPVC